MRGVEGVRRRAGWAILAALLAWPALTQAASVPFNGVGYSGEPLQLRFDPLSRQTRVGSHSLPGPCFSFELPQEWHLATGGPDTRLKAAISHAELEVRLRSTHELRGMPEADLASRDAALLQRDYENLLGRPAQSVSLASLANGATRWSATWYDAQLPTDSHGMTVEAFILPLSSDWVLELSLSNVESREEYNALVRTLLADLTVQDGATCRG